MSVITVDLPDEVLASPVELPCWSLPGADNGGFPAALVLEWVDSQPIGPWSLALLAQVNPDELHPNDRPAYLQAWQRVQSYAGARILGGIEAIRSAPAECPTTLEPAAHEVSVALREPVGAAQTRVHVARRVTRFLPGTRALHADGRLTDKHVTKMALATTGLSAEQCAAVEDRVLPGAEELSVHEFARRVRRAVAQVDPKSHEERHRKEAAGSDVTVDPDDDAMAWLTARMPMVDALIVKKAVDHYALSRKKAGDRRPIGVLRTEALVRFAEAYTTGRVTGTTPTQHGRPLEVRVTASPETLLGLSELPGEVPGVGPVPASVVREMAREARLRWMTIHPDTGTLIDLGTKTYRVPTATRAHTTAAYVSSVGPHSTVPAERCDIDHVVPFPHGPTDPRNLVPLDRGWHIAKTSGGLLATRRPDGSIEWSTPLGQTVTVHPYDYRLGP